MKRIKGFTLIEVLVVLSLLALIAILAYNVFGNTMKDAKLEQQALKYKKDLQLLADASEAYFKDNSSYTGIRNGFNLDKFKGLVDGGYINSVPLPDQSTIDGATVRYYDNAYGGYLDMGGPSTAAEVLLYSPDGYLTDELCKKYNEMFAPTIGPNVFETDTNGWDLPTMGTQVKSPTYCADAFGDVDMNTIYYVVELR